MKLIMLIAVLFTVGINISTAQLCAGSLGDPLLNETFGTGQFILPAYKTTYTYVGDCPDQMGGTYTTSDFIFGCGPHTWTKMIGDHTGNNLNSNYMLVNGASTPGTVYTDTIKDVCGNTVYQFEAWVTAVMTSFACDGKPILPNVKFTLKTLSGTVLAMDSTGFLPVVDDREWKPYGFSVRTPADVSDLIIAITMDPKYGCGSVFGLDDITFAPCGPSISVNIDGTPGPADVCADYTDASNPFIMTAKYSDGFADPVVQWQSSIDSGVTWVDIPGETTLTYKVPHRETGLILYRISIAERNNISSLHCRISSNIIYTRIHPLALNTPPQTLLGCLYKTLFLPETDPHALQVAWSGPNGYRSAEPNSTIQNIQYSDTGLYKLKETFYFNCVTVDTFYLNVFPGTTVSVVAGYPLCEGQSEKLSAIDPDIVSYKWTPAVGLSGDTVASPLAKPIDSTKYKVLVTNSFGCQDSAYVDVEVYRNPVSNAGPDVSLLIGDTVKLKSSVGGTGITFYWSPALYIDDINSTNPHVYPRSVTKYTLTVSSNVGCGSVTDDVIVSVYSDIFIPNAFTPNGDGKNDKFELTALDSYKLIRLIVYNRWGQLVFQSESSYNGWDGTVGGVPQPPGAYVYRVELLSPAKKKIIKQGTILLIR